MGSSSKLLDRTFERWVDNKDPVRARIEIFEKIRDIPYAIVTELIGDKRYIDILKVGRGSCTPKHLLLAEMYQRLGLPGLFVVYPFSWGERNVFTEEYPAKLKNLAIAQPPGYHLSCKIEIEGRLVTVDATLDPPLAKSGCLPVNLSWDGLSDTILQ